MGGLSRKESEVSVIVDGRERRFRLRSHSITKQLEQLEVQERGRRLGLDLSEDSFASETTITDANRAYLASIEPVILWLLRDPVDGGKPLTSAEYWLMDINEPLRILAEQEELTNMDSIMGKALALQQTAGRQLLQRSKEDGEPLELPSRRPASRPTATRPSMSGRLSSAWKRITTRVSSFGGKRRSKSG